VRRDYRQGRKKTDGAAGGATKNSNCRSDGRSETKSKSSQASDVCCRDAVSKPGVPPPLRKAEAQRRLFRSTLDRTTSGSRVVAKNAPMVSEKQGPAAAGDEEGASVAPENRGSIHCRDIAGSKQGW
jgi:hypothetical protein